MSMEDLYKQFPDVHPDIILKTAILRDGMKISDEAKRQFSQMDDVLWKGMHLFSFDSQKTVVYSEKIPHAVHLPSGSPIQLRTNVYSPYTLDCVNGQFIFTENGEVIGGPLSFDRKPKWYEMALEDGTPMRALVQSFCLHNLFITLNKYCELFNTGDQCLFCNMNPTLVKQRKGGENVVARIKPSQIAETVKMALEIEPSHRMIEITGGTFLKKYRGQAQLDFYCSRLEAIRDTIHVWVPSMLQISPCDDEGWKRLHDTGIQTIQSNIEVWDERLFKWICPGKDKFIGRNEWIKRVIRSVDFWGRGCIQPNFVIGVEMAKPYGFVSVSSAVRSTASGWDFLMSHGVLPRYNLWYIEPNSGFAGQERPPMEYFVEVEKAYAELRWKHGFAPPFPGAIHFTAHVLNCLQDYEYYHGSGVMSKRGREAALRRGQEARLAT